MRLEDAWERERGVKKERYLYRRIYEHLQIVLHFRGLFIYYETQQLEEEGRYLWYSVE